MGDSKNQQWITIERPGYLGKTRDSRQETWNSVYGELEWRFAWQKGNDVIIMPEALKLYEDGYFEYFKKNPARLNWLVKKASNIYDTDPSNVEAGLEYKIGDTPSNHIHDIAIRNAVKRHDKEFLGDKLLRVRWKSSEGYALNPGVVPFHLPELISKEPVRNYGGAQWWRDGTIEDFYQKNKLLQIRDY
jgi:hypothetical protein